MREKYLIDIKNAMFWHFSSSEIKDTLEELNTHFESARHSGLSEKEVISQYGKPEIVAKELRDEVNPIERKRKRLVIAKGILYTVCVFAIYIVFSIFSLNIAVNIFAVLSPVLIWFFSGNNCVIGVLSTTREKRRNFIKSQIAVFLFILFLHLFSFIIIPYIIGAGHNTFFGQNIMFFIDLIKVTLCLITIFYSRKMLQGNLYMFFIVIQNIAIILGLFLYTYFLRNIETIENIQFVFTPYFISLPILSIYWIYIHKRGDKIGCTD